MSFGRKRGYSDCIRGVRARNVLAAADFAVEIGRPLNVALDINWSKTSARDDTHGLLFAAFRKNAGRFLRKNGGGGLTCSWARERPTSPVPRPNTHMNCHIPARLYDAFVKRAHSFLPLGCIAFDPAAIFIQLIGLTEKDHVQRTEYLIKGAHPKARLNIKKRRSPQGRVHGKRCGTSEDIGLAARIRAAEILEERVISAARRSLNGSN